MQINQLRLVNYRNYQDQNVTFSKDINIFYGENAQGKTNLLESLFLISRGYSHRNASSKDLIRFNQEAFFLASEIFGDQTSHRIYLKGINGKKGWKLDSHSNVSFQKIEPFMGCIIFEPNDLDLIKKGPALRRRFLNWEISGLIDSYKSTYREFERVRLQRNALIRQIKQGKSDTSFLTPWDEQLSNLGSEIYFYRQSYLNKLTKAARNYHQRLSSSKEVLDLNYQTNIFKTVPKNKEDIKQAYLTKLQNEWSSDVERGFTRLGPHADDIEILLNNRSARIFGSQGQQRTAAIALKLSHIPLYKNYKNIQPIVLLDDILSELDLKRQENILNCLEKTQTFITCTNLEFTKNLNEKITTFHIEDGRII